MKERFGKRLRMARKMAGLSQDQLVQALDGKVSKNAISKYEHGRMLPDQGTLEALAEALGVKQAYFFRSFQVEVGEVSFRKSSKLKRSEEARLKGETSDRLERYLELEELLGIREAFENPIEDRRCNSFREVQAAAGALRERWELGLNPIPNVLEMLENNGIKVIEFQADKDFDGLSSYVQDVPVIVLNQRADNTRKRFSALHELAHLLLDFPEESSSKEEERFCDAFASEMLIPEDVLIEELGQNRHQIALQELVELKEYYGISVAALFYKAHKSGIIPDAVARRFWQKRNKDEKLKKEIGLGDYQGKEHSDRFLQLIWRAAAEEFISMSKAADLAQMKLASFRKEFLAL